MKNTDPSSRYYAVPTRYVNGVEEVDVRARTTPSRFRFRTYITREDERLDHLGTQLVDRASQWWRIADANDELFPLPEPATRLRVPQ